MDRDNPPNNRYDRALWVALFVFAVIVCFELAAILILNSGRFVFTLDDPYIHLALAENILTGNYGVNANEPSAPSSSILWPLIIAPFSRLSFSPYAVLILNILPSIGALFVFWKLLLPIESTDVERSRNAVRTLTFVLIVLIVAVNIVGLIFTGMEHSLQLFLSLLIVYGIAYETENRTITPWFSAALIAGPLIRYECLALSLTGLIFMFVRGYRVKSTVIGGILLLSLGAFAVFLVSQGLDPFPTSVMAKSSIVSSGGGVSSVLGTLRDGLQSSRGVLLVVGLSLLLYVALDRLRRKEERLFAFTIASSAVLHLLAGKYGWYSRYEIYIWASVLLTLLYLHKDRLYGLFEEMGFYKAAALASVSTILLCAPYLYALVTTPIVSNSIYEQHYQMHRFATEFYNQPLAVNDLGYVSFQNDNYILDLGGLASAEALKARGSSRDAEWMARIAKDKNIKFAMIYDNVFRGVPDHWHKIGELSSLGKISITPALSSVSFYALDCDSYQNLYRLSEEFSKTLPSQATFTFVNKIDPGDCSDPL